MLNKDLFIRTLETMEKYNKLVDEFCTVLEKMSPACYCDAYIYADYEKLVMDHLSEHFDEFEMDAIQYFVYELNYGKDYLPNCFLEDEKEVDISSIEKLYEYLERYEMRKKEEK